ncbi:hypothetical protein [Paraglaciecola psychrophila]|jgi:hypothetical protein|uniref:Lipase/esterase n=1 Tax=Paraglaciecola psychrophila 170 TaxID=1129794 RepID=K7A4E1_9ALTE|nr:hypothetical protein [Paraglaciecola psychrophila]AGH46127.1 lipase/esterase [Paraglaciecola psychrophila 170]GAC35733.1 hypothetical protein GPSY_0086 [Paraglaciecola psychrophila 170]
MPKDKTAEYHLANPSKQPSHTITTILQGDKDDIVPVFELDKLQRRVILLEGGGRFDWIHPGSEAFKTLTQQLDGLAK